MELSILYYEYRSLKKKLNGICDKLHPGVLGKTRGRVTNVSLSAYCQDSALCNHVLWTVWRRQDRNSEIASGLAEKLTQYEFSMMQKRGRATVFWRRALESKLRVTFWQEECNG